MVIPPQLTIPIGMFIPLGLILLVMYFIFRFLDKLTPNLEKEFRHAVQTLK